MANFFNLHGFRNYNLLKPKRNQWRMRTPKIAIGVFTVIAVLAASGTILYFATLNYHKSSVLCYKDWVNVHLVPHTHDDVGWLKTPEQYYYKDVRYILSNVVKELQKNRDRKFVYVEMYFFWKWWSEQSPMTRAAVNELVQNGQLEFIGGGWCMSDEAVSHYQSFIDQLTWGFRFLNDTFGISPTVGWQIDTFGHSRELASLMAEMGFDSLFFARIDMDDREYRKKNKLMEFIWEGDRNLGSSSNIFTSVMHKHYSAPSGFDFEFKPKDEPVDFEKFSGYVRDMASKYKTNDVMIPMGDDFRYYDARKYFDKIDELIRLSEANPKHKLKIFYSTPSQYVHSLQNLSVTWPRKTGDFFPYASDRHSYWTGYYTSRPTLKYFERISNNFLQVCKQLLVIANTGVRFFNHLSLLREAVAVLQHHDAMTGTAQQHVTDHYSEMLHYGIAACSDAIKQSLPKLVVNDSSLSGSLEYESCLRLNISECDASERYKSFIVTVYNPLSLVTDHYVRVPVTKKQYSVRNSRGEYQNVQFLAIPESVKNIPGRQSPAKFDLLFKAVNIPPLGFKSFYVSSEPASYLQNMKKNTKEEISSKKKVTVSFDKTTNLTTEVTVNDQNYFLNQSIRYYKGSHHWTGAYIFRPAEETTHEAKETVRMSVLNEGELVTEYEQVFSHWASQIIRVYKDEEFVEFEWLVGPIPVSDFIGKEVISVYSSKIKSGKTFYTEVNGRGMEERIRNYREWGGEVFEKVSGNYYPVMSQIAIKDSSSQMYVVNDRPQGGSSLNSGDIELMVHRRLCYDDGKGVDEPLNETSFGFGLIARGKHWLIFGNANDSNLGPKVKQLAQKRNSEPWLFFSDASETSFQTWSLNHLTEFSGLTTDLPTSIRILTLESWSLDTVLLRLEHIYERYPETSHSKPVDVTLKSLFRNFEIVEARETTLGGNKWLSESKRLNWKAEVKDLINDYVDEDRLYGNMAITLSPQEIRTFIIKIKPIN